MGKIELLAPGSVEAFYAGIDAGADAVCWAEPPLMPGCLRKTWIYLPLKISRLCPRKR